MLRVIFILVLWTASSKSQLNYEGNPLTENTEYTAEESHYTTRQDGKRSQNFYDKNQYLDSYGIETNKYNKINGEKFISSDMTIPEISDKSIDTISMERQPQDMNRLNINNKLNSIVNERSHENILYNTNNKINIDTNQTGFYPQKIILPATNALNNFLNSKTPEESRWALDNYLNNQQQVNQVQSQMNPQDYSQIKQQDYSQINQQDYSQINQQDYSQIYNNHNYKTVNGNDNNNINGYHNNLLNSPNVQHTPLTIPARDDSQFYHNQQLLSPWQQQISSRKDFITAPRRRPTSHSYRQMSARRVPSHYRSLQPRIGPNFISKPPHFSGPPPASFHHSKKPVEIIYTKPPISSHGPPHSNPNELYFPDDDHKSFAKDLSYSQLWAQSYDPHYYNYIAKTGKIKPWLYGKLGKHEEDSGFWSELFINFKKHGMKNMMNPMFLMGLSIPMLTLMLSALVQKRSFARSNSDYYLSEDKINEMVEKVSWAIECYKQNNTKCWK